MDEHTLKGLRERVDAKLRFAQIHLVELKGLSYISGDDFDRAHQESFLYHLLSAKDAFLMELNAYYNVKLSENNITAGKLRKEIIRVGKSSEELNELFLLETDKETWLYHAKAMRDHSMHISGVPRSYYEGGEMHQQVHLKNPKSGHLIEIHFVEVFSDWLKNMEILLDRLRKSAIKKNDTFNYNSENTQLL